MFSIYLKAQVEINNMAREYKTISSDCLKWQLLMLSGQLLSLEQDQFKTSFKIAVRIGL